MLCEQNICRGILLVLLALILTAHSETPVIKHIELHESITGNGTVIPLLSNTTLYLWLNTTRAPNPFSWFGIWVNRTGFLGSVVTIDSFPSTQCAPNESLPACINEEQVPELLALFGRYQTELFSTMLTLSPKANTIAVLKVYSDQIFPEPEDTIKIHLEVFRKSTGFNTTVCRLAHILYADSTGLDLTGRNETLVISPANRTLQEEYDSPALYDYFLFDSKKLGNSTQLHTINVQFNIDYGADPEPSMGYEICVRSFPAGSIANGDSLLANDPFSICDQQNSQYFATLNFPDTFPTDSLLYIVRVSRTVGMKPNTAEYNATLQALVTANMLENKTDFANATKIAWLVIPGTVLPPDDPGQYILLTIDNTTFTNYSSGDTLSIAFGIFPTAGFKFADMYIPREFPIYHTIARTEVFDGEVVDIYVSLNNTYRDYLAFRYVVCHAANVSESGTLEPHSMPKLFLFDIAAQLSDHPAAVVTVTVRSSDILAMMASEGNLPAYLDWDMPFGSGSPINVTSTVPYVIQYTHCNLPPNGMLGIALRNEGNQNVGYNVSITSKPTATRLVLNQPMREEFHSGVGHFYSVNKTTNMPIAALEFAVDVDIPAGVQRTLAARMGSDPAGVCPCFDNNVILDEANPAGQSKHSLLSDLCVLSRDTSGEANFFAKFGESREFAPVSGNATVTAVYPTGPFNVTDLPTSLNLTARCNAIHLTIPQIDATKRVRIRVSLNTTNNSTVIMRVMTGPPTFCDEVGECHMTSTTNTNCYVDSLPCQLNDIRNGTNFREIMVYVTLECRSPCYAAVTASLEPLVVAVLNATAGSGPTNSTATLTDVMENTLYIAAIDLSRYTAPTSVSVPQLILSCQPPNNTVGTLPVMSYIVENITDAMCSEKPRESQCGCPCFLTITPAQVATYANVSPNAGIYVTVHTVSSLAWLALQLHVVPPYQVTTDMALLTLEPIWPYTFVEIPATELNGSTYITVEHNMANAMMRETLSTNAQRPWNYAGSSDMCDADIHHGYTFDSEQVTQIFYDTVTHPNASILLTFQHAYTNEVILDSGPDYLNFTQHHLPILEVTQNEHVQFAINNTTVVLHRVFNVSGTRLPPVIAVELQAACQAQNPVVKIWPKDAILYTNGDLPPLCNPLVANGSSISCTICQAVLPASLTSDTMEVYAMVQLGSPCDTMNATLKLYHTTPLNVSYGDNTIQVAINPEAPPSFAGCALFALQYNPPLEVGDSVSLELTSPPGLAYSLTTLQNGMVNVLDFNALRVRSEGNTNKEILFACERTEGMLLSMIPFSSNVTLTLNVHPYYLSNSSSMQTVNVGGPTAVPLEWYAPQLIRVGPPSQLVAGQRYSVNLTMWTTRITDALIARMIESPAPGPIPLNSNCGAIQGDTWECTLHNSTEVCSLHIPICATSPTSMWTFFAYDCYNTTLMVNLSYTIFDTYSNTTILDGGVHSVTSSNSVIVGPIDISQSPLNIAHIQWEFSHNCSSDVIGYIGPSPFCPCGGLNASQVVGCFGSYAMQLKGVTSVDAGFNVYDCKPLTGSKQCASQMPRAYWGPEQKVYLLFYKQSTELCAVRFSVSSSLNRMIAVVLNDMDKTHNTTITANVNMAFVTDNIPKQRVEQLFKFTLQGAQHPANQGPTQVLRFTISPTTNMSDAAVIGGGVSFAIVDENIDQQFDGFDEDDALLIWRQRADQDFIAYQEVNTSSLTVEISRAALLNSSGLSDYYDLPNTTSMDIFLVVGVHGSASFTMNIQWIDAKPSCVKLSGMSGNFTGNCAVFTLTGANLTADNYLLITTNTTQCPAKLNVFFNRMTVPLYGGAENQPSGIAFVHIAPPDLHVGASYLIEVENSSQCINSTTVIQLRTVKRFTLPISATSLTRPLLNNVGAGEVGDIHVWTMDISQIHDPFGEAVQFLATQPLDFSISSSGTSEVDVVKTYYGNQLSNGEAFPWHTHGTVSVNTGEAMPSAFSLVGDSLEPWMITATIIQPNTDRPSISEPVLYRFITALSVVDPYEYLPIVPWVPAMFAPYWTNISSVSTLIVDTIYESEGSSMAMEAEGSKVFYLNWQDPESSLATEYDGALPECMFHPQLRYALRMDMQNVQSSARLIFERGYIPVIELSDNILTLSDRSLISGREQLYKLIVPRDQTRYIKVSAISHDDAVLTLRFVSGDNWMAKGNQMATLDLHSNFASGRDCELLIISPAGEGGNVYLLGVKSSQQQSSALLMYDLTITPIQQPPVVDIVVGDLLKDRDCIAMCDDGVSGTAGHRLYRIVPYASSASMSMMSVVLTAESLVGEVTLFIKRGSVPTEQSYDTIFSVFYGNPISKPIGCLSITEPVYLLVATRNPQPYRLKFCWRNYTTSVISLPPKSRTELYGAYYNASGLIITNGPHVYYLPNAINATTLAIAQPNDGVIWAAEGSTVPGLTCPFSGVTYAQWRRIFSDTPPTGWTILFPEEVAVKKAIEVFAPSGTLRVAKGNSTGETTVTLNSFRYHEFAVNASVLTDIGDGSKALLGYGAKFSNVKNRGLLTLTNVGRCIYPFDYYDNEEHILTTIPRLSNKFAGMTCAQIEEAIATNSTVCVTVTTETLSGVEPQTPLDGTFSFETDYSISWEAQWTPSVPLRISCTDPNRFSTQISVSQFRDQVYTIVLEHCNETTIKGRFLTLELFDIDHGAIDGTNMKIYHTKRPSLDGDDLTCVATSKPLQQAKGYSRGDTASYVIDRDKAVPRSIYYVQLRAGFEVDFTPTTKRETTEAYVYDQRYGNVTFTLRATLVDVILLGSQNRSVQFREQITPQLAVVSMKVQRTKSFGFTIHNKTGSSLVRVFVFTARSDKNEEGHIVSLCKWETCPYYWLYPSHMPAALSTNEQDIYIELVIPPRTSLSLSIRPNGVEGSCISATSLLPVNSSSDSPCISSMFRTSAMLIAMDSDTVARRQTEVIHRLESTINEVDSTCCTIDQECIDALTRFFCLDSFRECDSGGFATPVCQNMCQQVAESCQCNGGNDIWQVVLGGSMQCNSERYGRVEPCTGGTVVVVSGNSSSNGTTTTTLTTQQTTTSSSTLTTTTSSTLTTTSSSDSSSSSSTTSTSDSGTMVNSTLQSPTDSSTTGATPHIDSQRTHSKSDKSASKMPAWAYVLVGVSVAGVAFGAVAIALYVRQKKRKATVIRVIAKQVESKAAQKLKQQAEEEALFGEAPEDIAELTADENDATLPHAPADV